MLNKLATTLPSLKVTYEEQKIESEAVSKVHPMHFHPRA